MNPIVATPLPDLPTLYLASASPRRHELLQQAHIPHDVLVLPEEYAADESIIANEHPADYVQRVANQKAQHALAYLQQHADCYQQNRPILCADTCVFIGQHLIDKAYTAEDVQRSLRALSGQEHQVHTHVVLVVADHIYECTSRNLVRLRELSNSDIAHYVASGEGIGKAGGYAIQGLGGTLVQHIEGSYSGIVGLPLAQTWQLLRDAGLV